MTGAHTLRERRTGHYIAGMNDPERAIMRQLYELQVELFNHQGEEIEALRKATESLRKSHEVIGQMMALTAKLSGFA